MSTDPYFDFSGKIANAVPSGIATASFASGAMVRVEDGPAIGR